MSPFSRSALLVPLMAIFGVHGNFDSARYAEFSCTRVQDQILDVVVLMDGTCPMTHLECTNQQREVAETVAAIRGTTTHSVGGQNYPAVRVGYVEYGSGILSVAKVVIPLATSEFNAVNVNMSQTQQSLYATIRDSSICNGNTTNRVGQANLDNALRTALDELNHNRNLDTVRDKKILLYTNCPVGSSEREQVCRKYANELLYGDDESESGNTEGHHLVMVNNIVTSLGQFKDLPQVRVEESEYISCLVGGDGERILVHHNWNDGELERSLIGRISDEICEVPTPSPSADPTSWPTSDPTTDPSPQPTAAPTQATSSPSYSPSSQSPTELPTLTPSSSPTTTQGPSGSPSASPSSSPSQAPSSSTMYPTTLMCRQFLRKEDCQARAGCAYVAAIEECVSAVLAQQSTSSTTTTTTSSTTTTTTSSTTTPTTTSTSMSSVPPLGVGGLSTSTSSSGNSTALPVSEPISGPSKPVAVWVYIAVAAAALCGCGLIVAFLVYCCRGSGGRKHEGYGYVATNGGGEYLSENDASRSINQQAVPAYRDEEIAPPADAADELQGLAGYQ